MHSVKKWIGQRAQNQSYKLDLKSEMIKIISKIKNIEDKAIIKDRS